MIGIMRAASVYPARRGVPDTELRCRFRQKREVRQYKVFFENIKALFDIDISWDDGISY
jgi:hypothetical protein